jgi:hypothetical protein
VFDPALTKWKLRRDPAIETPFGAIVGRVGSEDRYVLHSLKLIAVD